MKRLQPYTKEWLEKLCKESRSYNEVLIKAGRKIAGGNQATLKKKIAEFQIDVSHFSGQGWSKGKTVESDSGVAKRTSNLEKYDLNEIFVENSPYERHLVRNYIIRHKLLPYQCQECGNKGIWRNKQIALQLDHINGINNDNRLENLRFLCPNCHAATETFAGKNINKATLDEEAILNAIEQGATNASELCSFNKISVNGTNLNKAKFIALKLGYKGF